MTEATQCQQPNFRGFPARQTEPKPPRFQTILIELPVGIPHRRILLALGALIHLGGRIVDVGERQ